MLTLFFFFWRDGGGEQTRCIMGDVRMRNLLHFVESRGWVEKLAVNFQDECNSTSDSFKKYEYYAKNSSNGGINRECCP